MDYIEIQKKITALRGELNPLEYIMGKKRRKDVQDNCSHSDTYEFNSPTHPEGNYTFHCNTCGFYNPKVTNEFMNEIMRQ